MLQIASGKFFRPGVPLHESEHRFTVYSNAWLVGENPITLPLGEITPSTDVRAVSSAMITVTDRLEAQRPDGTDEFMFATRGTDLVDDVAYVLTFVLNRTVGRDHDQVHRLVSGDGASRRRSANDLFPGLFEPQQAVQPEEWRSVRDFMQDLIGLSRDDFVRVIRAIRRVVDATRRALDDPTGAYTDMVAALESISSSSLAPAASWDRYDGSKRKIIDAALVDTDEATADRVRAAVLEAERTGLKRRFVSSTLARLSPEYYRSEAIGTVRPPRAPDMERMLSVAYDVRSRRSHVLEDLGEGVWVFTDGAETAYEPNFERVLTLAGLWRLTRHVVRRYVSDAETVPAEPWDYRQALPGIVEMQLAPQYWIWQPGGLTEENATQRLDGFAEALIGWFAGDHTDGFPMGDVCREIQGLVPGLAAGEAKTALIATHALWHSCVDPKEHPADAAAFLEAFGPVLNQPSPSSFTFWLLGKQATPPWNADELAAMAQARTEARRRKDHAPLPPAIDALIQLETADRLEADGRHAEAVAFAANAVSEVPGNEMLIEWERRLVAGDHDPDFDVNAFLLGGRDKHADA
ncbi:hypothetical protein [Aeromicrobium sp. IC_218]|uniref:hypothetical protein n=1 Tax=Aeromicrobium sp. IC_218 TaxID=2545468 RepID=UPI00103A22DB|nr:hypothetical protein [Aeromicrobium sp. IC_218]TCI96407.1 hypothetical protein E0W78_14840 [Aeromicrobium sp. IC_218]